MGRAMLRNSSGCLDVLRNLPEVDWYLEPIDGWSLLSLGLQQINITMVHFLFGWSDLKVNRQSLFDQHLLERAATEARNLVRAKMTEVDTDRIQFAQQRGWSNDLTGLLGHGGQLGDAW